MSCRFFDLRRIFFFVTAAHPRMTEIFISVRFYNINITWPSSESTMFYFDNLKSVYFSFWKVYNETNKSKGLFVI